MHVCTSGRTDKLSCCVAACSAHVQDTCACLVSLSKATRPPKEQLWNTVCVVCLSRSRVQTQACPLPDDKIVIYGGEDGHRRPLAEAHVLDLQVGLKPSSPRSGVCLQRSSCLDTNTCP